MMMMMKKEELTTAQQKITAEWDAMAGEWDDLASGYAKAFYRMLLTKITAHLNEASSSLVVVDFGCGTGLLTEKLQSNKAFCKKILAIDASPKMIEMLQEKIKCRAWTNVTAHAVVLANLNDNDNSMGNNNNNNNNSQKESSSLSLSLIQDELDSLQGSVDLIVASSVLTFIPQDDLVITMRILTKLLKPGTGLFIHSDWPKSSEQQGANHPDAMSEEKALQIYSMASSEDDDANDNGGLQMVSMGIEPFDMGDNHGTVDVFVGVARKPTA